jgi:hypothetical protein
MDYSGSVWTQFVEVCEPCHEHFGFPQRGVIFMPDEKFTFLGLWYRSLSS